MLHIKKFVDKVSYLEGTKTKDLVLPLNDARMLRDEIAKLLADLVELNNKKTEEKIKVDIKGKGFK
jgi:hypothetical protein